MKMSREVAVGLIFFAILGVLGFFTVYLSDIHFGRGQYLTVDFGQVKGLKQGDNVMVLGLKSGKVKTIALNPNGKGVRVTLWLKEPVTLTEDYDLLVSDATLLGGKQIDIDPGTPGKKPVDTSVPLPGRSTPELAKALSSVIDDNREPLHSAIRDLSQITSDIRQAKGLLGALIYDEAMKESVAQTLRNVTKATDEIANGRGTLGKLVYDDDLYQKVDQAAGNVAAVTADIRAGKGVVGRLFTDEQLSSDLRDSVANVREVTGGLARGEGTAGKFLKDDTLYENLSAFAKNGNAVLEGVNKGEGTLGKLVKDPALYDNANQIVADVRTIVADVKNGEGSLGKLLRRDDLYNEVARVFQQIRGAVQDAREAAPITTFTAALFAIF
ncbi:MAG: MCE family protein [Planctomycetes bacterium]|nr:MCE family protein [Planctomycetota bacterium]